MNIRLREPMLLFVAGALLYVAGAKVWVTIVGEDGLTGFDLLIPLFGLPFLLLGRCPRWRTALYLLLLVPAFHYLAVLAAIYSLDGLGRSGILPPGAVGGVIGATLSFLGLAALRLARRRTAVTMVAGVVVLTFLGYVGVAEMDFLEGTPLSDFGVLLSLYLPWQLTFGFFLSRVLRVPPEAEADTCPNLPGAP
ncbi:MAG TPA: hypothetical protein VGC56_10280 [Allosphingosinicella sp.]|jgi:hypothetical protein